MGKCVVSVKVNGRRYERTVEPRMLLSDFLRHELSLTGTHVGCEHGVCGSCTVLVDGVATRSCLCFAVQVEGQSIETVESLGRVETLHPIQLAFWEKHGLQCGFCTPGMLMSAVELSAAIFAAAPAIRTSSRPSSEPPSCSGPRRRLRDDRDPEELAHSTQPAA